MRLIPISEAKEGMMVAQTIYGLNGEVLVKSGMEIKSGYLEKLKERYCEYIYIYDELSRDVEIKCTISAQVRNEAIQNIKALYTSIQVNKDIDIYNSTFSKNIHQNMQNCLGSVDKILEDIIAEKISLVDVFDVKLFKNYKYAHSVNVLIISLVLGKALELNGYDLYKLGVGAFFHDMGQMFLPEYVINKEDKFTDEEYTIMRRHPEIGYRYAKDQFNLPTTSYLAILQHHERYDGTGYPHQKQGEEISQFGRIVAIADVFDALTSMKKYRPSLSPVGAFKYLINNSGRIFDPKLVKLFISKVSPYPIGFTLNLEDGIEAIVVENYEDNPLHPKIRVFKEKGIILEEAYTKIL